MGIVGEQIGLDLEDPPWVGAARLAAMPSPVQAAWRDEPLEVLSLGLSGPDDPYFDAWRYAHYDAEDLEPVEA